MAGIPQQPVVEIRKYPNRRFYDATHSRHVTLPEIHDLICAGRDVLVRDARSGDDITNVVLMQIILERDAPKLAVFPANVLHLVIRTQQQFLGGVFEQFFHQMSAAYRQSQENWARMIGMPPPPPSEAPAAGAGPAPPTPMEWARRWMQAFTPPSPAAPEPPPAAPRSQPSPQTQAPAEMSAAPAAEELDALRQQIAELSRKIERLSQ